MARKSKSRNKSGSTSRDSSGDSAQAVRDSAQKIWLAGLGAFERAKSEGPRMFETLVEQAAHGCARRRRGRRGAEGTAPGELRMSAASGTSWSRSSRARSRSLTAGRSHAKRSRTVPPGAGLNADVRNLMADSGKSGRAARRARDPAPGRRRSPHRARASPAQSAAAKGAKRASGARKLDPAGAHLRRSTRRGSAWSGPRIRMMIVGVMMLEGRLGAKELKRVLDGASSPPAFPPARRAGRRRRLVADRRGARPLAPVRTVHLSRKAGKRELEDLVSRLASTPLDFSRPLWQFDLVDNTAAAAR